MMTHRDLAIMAAGGKLQEASFFLGKLREAAGHAQLDEAERQFGWYLSAFLSAARSVPQIISGLEGRLQGSDKDDWSWAEKSKQGWGADDLELFRSLNGLRNLAVHQGQGGVNSTIEFVPEAELPFQPRNPMGGYVIISRPPGTPPPRFGMKKFTVCLGALALPAIECAAKYLVLVERMLNHYTRAGAGN